MAARSMENVIGKQAQINGKVVPWSDKEILSN